MKTYSASRRPGRRPARLTASVVCAVALLASGLIVVGCGGSSTAESSAPAAAEEIESMSGSELGDAAGATWTAAMQELVTMLADKPEPATVKAQVEELKEQTVQKLVALGRQRAALEPTEKAEMAARISSALAAATGQDWWERYAEIQGHYASGDVEFGNLIADFNVITQYADLDLLKQQAPDEAARLGIE
jgi:hypothetical protein